MCLAQADDWCHFVKIVEIVEFVEFAICNNVPQKYMLALLSDICVNWFIFYPSLLLMKCSYCIQNQHLHPCLLNETTYILNVI